MKNEPKFISLHCAATPDKGDLFGASDIDKWHKDRGWNGIGYHFVIRRSGVIEVGRPIEKIPAAVMGHNKGNLAICLMGTRKFTKEQINSFINLYLHIYETYDIDPEKVLGHYEFPKVDKTCPNIQMPILRRLLEHEVKLYERLLVFTKE